MQQLIITENEAGGRLDKYLLKYFDAAPSSFVYKNLRKKNIKLGRKKASGSEILRAGDEIDLYFSDATLTGLSSFAARLLTACDDESVSADRVSGRREHLTEKVPPKARKQENAACGVLDISEYCGIIYEDDSIIIADKRPGVLSQKAKPGDISLNEALLNYVNAKKSSSGPAAGKDAGFYTPSVCNRLDRNTSGIITFAKTYAAARELNRIFRDRSAGKYYLTVVGGKVTREVSLKAWLIKDERNNTVRVFDSETEGAAKIETVYEPVKTGRLFDTDVTVLRVKLVTGKTHQIRAHLAYAGHPVLGDIKYGDSSLAHVLNTGYHIRHQLLHSCELIMPDNLNVPIAYLSGRSFKAEPYASFKKVLDDIS